jgi:uncharacterized RDD family membrane protein YckC
MWEEEKMNYTIILFIIKCLTEIPLFILLYIQGRNLYLRWSTSNGLRKTRIALFLLTAVIFIETLLHVAADINEIFLGGSVAQFLENHQPETILIRLFISLSVYYFYILIWQKQDH